MNVVFEQMLADISSGSRRSCGSCGRRRRSTCQSAGGCESRPHSVPASTDSDVGVEHRADAVAPGVLVLHEDVRQADPCREQQAPQETGNKVFKRGF